MAYKVPNFPLSCNVYSSDATGILQFTVGPRLTVNCQLKWVAGGSMQYPNTLSGAWIQREFFFPAGTDIRVDSTLQMQAPVTHRADYLECPAGSGRWYYVNNVDDVAKGFSNEYRMATAFPIGPLLDDSGPANHQWPMPIP